MFNADAFWDSAAAIAEAIVAQRQAARAAQKERRRARDRARYARRKAAGTLTPRLTVKEIEQAEASEPIIGSCYCHACRMPPCSWCTSQEEEE